MEQIDREKAQRVWQRVQGRQPQSPPATNLSPGPEGFVLEELTDGRLLLQLAGQRRELANGALRQLAAQAQERAAVLMGICRLTATAFPEQLPKPAARENSQAALRRLMGGHLRRHEQYEQLGRQGEFAPVYQVLAHKIRDSAALLLQIIGKNDKNLA